MRRTEYRGPLRKKLEDTARWVVFDLMTDSGPQVGLEPTSSNRITTQSPKGSVDFECRPPREPAITLPECSRDVQNQGLFEAGDIEEAMGTASALGDDQIRRQPLDTWLSDSFYVRTNACVGLKKLRDRRHASGRSLQPRDLYYKRKRTTPRLESCTNLVFRSAV